MRKDLPYKHIPKNNLGTLLRAHVTSYKGVVGVSTTDAERRTSILLGMEGICHVHLTEHYLGTVE
jgi:hypothetical protein